MPGYGTPVMLSGNATTRPKIHRDNNVSPLSDPFATSTQDHRDRETAWRVGQWTCDHRTVIQNSCCRWRPRFNYPRRPQNMGIDLHGTKDAGRAYSMKKAQKVLLFMNGYDGRRGLSTMSLGPVIDDAVRTSSTKDDFFFLYSHTHRMSAKGVRRFFYRSAVDGRRPVVATSYNIVLTIWETLLLSLTFLLSYYYYYYYLSTIYEG